MKKWTNVLLLISAILMCIHLIVIVHMLLF